jgi:hypothetical protein
MAGCCQDQKKAHSASDDTPKVQPEGHTWMWCRGQRRCSGRVLRRGKRTRKKKQRSGGFDIAGVCWSHKPARAVSPDDDPIVFCTRCGGAHTGHTGGLIKGCLEIQDKESRLTRLTKGLRPYSKQYHVRVLGPARSWMKRERRPGSAAGGYG